MSHELRVLKSVSIYNSGQLEQYTNVFIYSELFWNLGASGHFAATDRTSTLIFKKIPDYKNCK